MPAKYKDTSPYSNTPISSWYLGLWEFRDVPKLDTDKLIEIPAKFDKRPDLLSQSEFGTPNLWWVFAIRNPDELIDPIEDFTAGKQIYVPTDITRI